MKSSNCAIFIRLAIRNDIYCRIRRWKLDCKESICVVVILITLVLLWWVCHLLCNSTRALCSAKGPFLLSELFSCTVLADHFGNIWELATLLPYKAARKPSSTKLYFQHPAWPIYSVGDRSVACNQLKLSQNALIKPLLFVCLTLSFEIIFYERRLW